MDLPIFAIRVTQRVIQKFSTLLLRGIHECTRDRLCKTLRLQLGNEIAGVTASNYLTGAFGVGDAASFRLYGLPSCNKGEPLQVAHIGHGTVPARFRDVAIGVR